MLLFKLLSAAGFALALPTSEGTQTSQSLTRRDTAKTPVSSAVYANLAYYAQFPMSGQKACTTTPAGIVEQQWIDNVITETQAAIFRIDSRKEFVLAIPGTVDWEDYVYDAQFLSTNYSSPGATCENCQVYTGFLEAWNSIVDTVQQGLETALAEYPGYGVTIAGHSLGGGLAELAFGSLKTQSALNIIGLYTYGCPRTGDQNYANYIDSLSGASDTVAGIYFRTTHYNDPFPSLPPAFLGYVHSRSEYWESTATAEFATTYQCYGQEPSDCINSLVPAFSYASHSNYAGMGNFCP